MDPKRRYASSRGNTHVIPWYTFAGLLIAIVSLLLNVVQWILRKKDSAKTASDASAYRAQVMASLDGFSSISKNSAAALGAASYEHERLLSEVKARAEQSEAATRHFLTQFDKQSS